MGDDADPSIPPAAPSEDTHVAESDESDALHPAIYACPHCGESVEIDPHITEPLIDCPHCREQFALPPTELAENTRDGDDETNHAGESELDGTRIRQLTTLRRAAIRARTYLQIGFVVCGTGGVQLTLKAMLRVRFEHVWDIRTFAFGLSSIACFMLAIHFFKRSVDVSRELHKPLLEEPATPPDFSTLSDGSQHARDLEDIR